MNSIHNIVVPSTKPRFGSRSCCSSRPRRSGFVLVFVLVLILVSALAVAGFARKSLELASTVADAQEDLQRRWGARSCQRYFLANAEQLLNDGQTIDSAASKFWPRPAVVDAEFDLGGHRYVVRLSDEDAKINLNALAVRGKDASVLISEVVQNVSASSGLLTLVRPTNSTDLQRKRAALETWEQVFDLHSETDFNETVPRLKSATAELTCWGSGKLNLQRATDACIRAVCENQVSTNSLNRLLNARRAGGFSNLDVLLGRLDLKSNDQSAFRRLLAIDSKCHALWVTIKTSRRSWSSFTIDRSGKGNPTTFESFTW